MFSKRGSVSVESPVGLCEVVYFAYGNRAGNTF